MPAGWGWPQTGKLNTNYLNINLSNIIKKLGHVSPQMHQDLLAARDPFMFFWLLPCSPLQGRVLETERPCCISHQSESSGDNSLLSFLLDCFRVQHSYFCRSVSLQKTQKPVQSQFKVASQYDFHKTRSVPLSAPPELPVFPFPCYVTSVAFHPQLHLHSDKLSFMHRRHNCWLLQQMVVLCFFKIS